MVSVLLIVEIILLVILAIFLFKNKNKPYQKLSIAIFVILYL